MLGDVISSSYQQSQLSQGVFSPKTVSVGDLFAGALIPGLLLVFLYITYLIVIGLIKPSKMPAHAVTVSGKIYIKNIFKALIVTSSKFPIGVGTM